MLNLNTSGIAIGAMIRSIVCTHAPRSMARARCPGMLQPDYGASTADALTGGWHAADLRNMADLRETRLHECGEREITTKLPDKDSNLEPSG